MSPKVSVIIASFNRADFIGAAIESVLSQDYSNLEIIVIDDGSTDETQNVLQPYAGRIHYIYQENKGRSEARNTGIHAAMGEYIAFLDSDDIWLPHKLEKQLSILESNPNIGLVHSLTGVIDEQGKRLSKETAKRLAFYQKAMRRGYTYEAMSLQCVMFLSSVIARRECIERVGLMDPDIPAFEDWDWYLRIALEYEVVLVPEVLARYRLHESNTSSEEFTEGRIKTCLKHLSLLERNPPAPYANCARRNFCLNLASAYYIRANPAESGHWMRQAARLDPTVLLHPARRGPILCALLPAAWTTWALDLKRRYWP